MNFKLSIIRQTAATREYSYYVQTLLEITKDNTSKVSFQVNNYDDETVKIIVIPSKCAVYIQ